MKGGVRMASVLVTGASGSRSARAVSLNDSMPIVLWRTRPARKTRMHSDASIGVYVMPREAPSSY